MTYRNDALELGPVLDGEVARRQNVDAIVLHSGLVRQTDRVRRLVTLTDAMGGREE